VERRNAIVIGLILGIASIGGILLLHLPDLFQVQHDPILIDENEDFQSQEWPGSGTLDDPYLISGLSIVSSDICISIESTTVHFTIRNCYISSTDHICAIQFSNIENGDFINNEVVDSTGHGLLIQSCQDVSITSNSISNNGLDGIKLNTAENCEISSNTINNNAGSGISLLYSWYCEISSNIITNNGEWGLLFTNSYGNVETDNTFQENELGSIDYQSC